jgi:hypothetical protein
MPVIAEAAGDPRFFGEYCGNHREEVSVVVPLFPLLPIPVRKTYHVDMSIRAHSDYHENTRGDGVVNGSGEITVEGHDLPEALAEEQGIAAGMQIPVAFSGYVAEVGKLTGYAVAPGRERTNSSVTLSGDGMEIRIRALERDVRLSKLQCGNRAPEARITTAADSFAWGRLNALGGSITDDEPGPFPDSRLTWRSDRDRSWVRHGYSAMLGDLSPGRHRITFEVTDSGGLTDSAEKSITIANTPPGTVTIFNPRDGSEFCEGQEITFDGWATDAESGNLTGLTEAMRWTYGSVPIGSGTPLSGVLPVGEHTVTLTASDGLASSQASVRVAVRPRSGRSCAPTVAIRRPVSNQVIGNGPRDCLAFQVDRASDPEDGELGDASIIWRDSAEGVAPREFRGRMVDPLPCGFFAGSVDTRHVISATAVDSDGNETTVSRTIYVIPVEGGPY